MTDIDATDLAEEVDLGAAEVTEIGDALVMIREHAEQLARACDGGLTIDWPAVQYLANQRDEIHSFLYLLDHALVDRSTELGQTFCIGDLVATSATGIPESEEP